MIHTPLSNDGAALSACGEPEALRSPSTANGSKSIGFSGLGDSALTATAAATLLAAELPSPDPIGIFFSNINSTPPANRRGVNSSSNNEATCAATLSRAFVGTSG